MERNHAGRAAQEPLAFTAADLVHQRVAVIDGWQRTEQRTIRSAALTSTSRLSGK